MGVWDYIYSTTDTLKRNSPDLTAVKGACWSSYDYSRSAVSKIDDVVRVNGIQKLNQCVRDDEVRSKIGRVATNVAKNAAVYAWRDGLKCVPGGGFIDYVVSRSFRDYSKSDDHKEEIKALQATVGRLEKEVSGCKKLIEQAEIVKCDVELESRNALHLDSNVNRKPEDAIRIFMMKEFMGTHLLDDLIVPGVETRKNPR
ncbi:hypothetical protein L1049_001220 [Liquidambar formosana]|uniref:Uncharacterized protein n=1 Tax=Liquidambar formosana TaxID=63359 RepID=A0AAP0R886_LIQFO